MLSKVWSTAPSTARELFRTLTFTWIAIWLPLGVLSLAYGLHLGTGDPEGYFMVHQDAVVIFAAPVIAFGLSLLAMRLPQALDAGWLLQRRTVFVAAALVLLLGALGAWLVFQNYAFSLDEYMADFDARIFGSGRLMAPVPAEWQPYARAMQPMFVLETEGHRFWASTYLPINALMRTGAAALHAQSLVNPLLAAIATIATWGAARQLWPDHPRRAVAAALLLATSSQFVITAMSGYAMTAHLAFNAVWLWLVLRDRRSSDLAAFAVGLGACGIHQLVFHPLFAGPFILEMLIARRWARAASFIGAYAVIGLFWIFWWAISFKLAGATPGSAASNGPGYFVSQLKTLASAFGPSSVGEMLLCLSRLAAWQNLLTLPLALIGTLLTLRRGGPLRAMAIGIVVVPVILVVIMPGQVHGWGYRYLHPFLGSMCLLAVFAWVELTGRLEAGQRVFANRAFALAGLISLVVLMPLHAYEAWSFTRPAVAAFEKVSHRPERVVIADNDTVAIDANFVLRNDPFLTNQPKMMLLGRLDNAQLDALCRLGPVWVFDGNDPAAKGLLVSKHPGLAEGKAKREHLRQIGCAA